VGYPNGPGKLPIAHEIAMRQTGGQASTVIYYRTLFDELARESEMARAKATS